MDKVILSFSVSFEIDKERLVLTEDGLEQDLLELLSDCVVNRVNSDWNIDCIQHIDVTSRGFVKIEV